MRISDWSSDVCSSDLPVIFIENLPTYRVPMAFALPASDHRVPLGKAAVQREGSDVTVVSYARMAVQARAAAEQATAEGISVEVVDLRTIAPWDRETRSAERRVGNECVRTCRSRWSPVK